MSTPTANMNPDQPNTETRAVTARLAVSEIMRVPLQVATGPTCMPQGFCPIRARFTFRCATSGHGGTLFSCKYCCDPKHASGLLSAQKQGSQQGSESLFEIKKNSAKQTSRICCRKENSTGQGACCWLKLGEGRGRGVSPSVTVYFRHVCIKCLGTQDVPKSGLTS